ncbi:MAG: arsenate reductase (glutaredoxin) [Pseudomonadota bacterium]
MPYSLYHNPRCSKSRQALALLQEREIELEVIEYLAHPPSDATLSRLVELLGLPAKHLVRTKESSFKDLGLNIDDLAKDEVISLLVQHPKLIERPIFTTDDQAVIGRPPENVLGLLDQRQ